ncbi:MAG: hypothetical protein CM1200mP9_03940 [Gammaproteobacteria bacterium]|nr:MAG: hypothetical protein CM1200mP9_03940 [Gammaproteobacteria bacterium]
MGRGPPTASKTEHVFARIRTDRRLRKRLGDLTKTIANGHQQKFYLARLDLISIVDGGDWLVAPFEGVPIVDGYPLRQIAVVWAEIHVDFGGHRERENCIYIQYQGCVVFGQFLR